MNDQAYQSASGPVTELGQTKNGSKKFKIGGQWYFPGRNLAGSFPTVGQSVELKYTLFGDKNDLRSLERWRTIAAAPQTQPQPSTALDGDSLRYISNILGNAVAAKTINSPSELYIWFEAAKAALNGKQYQLKDVGPVPGVDDLNGYQDSTDADGSWPDDPF